jgi:hypothetical protein
VDIAALLTGQERVVHLNPDLGHFSSAADDAVAPDIDVLGFNRGAAWGRDFANDIVSGTPIGCDRYSDRSGGAPCQHLNFRFMGLWDAVLSAHAATSNLSGPASFDHVAHPVTLNALNEYRALFPLESIREGIETLAAKVRIDRGVLGSHSDIGGGDADGAKVALTWMVNRAESAGVPMLPLDRNLVPSPVMHDKSSQLVKPTGPAPDLLGDDRSIRYGKGAAERQRRASVPGMSHADPAGFIGYDLRPRAVAGADDAEGYLSWLDAHGYELRMTVQ